MKRRSFLALAGMAVGGCAMPGRRGGEALRAAQHVTISSHTSPGVALPANQRVSFGWQAAPVAGAGTEPVVLRWSDAARAAGGRRLRLAVAIDFREERAVEARLAESGRPLGAFDIRFASVFQPYEIPLTPDQAEAVVREGVALRLVKGSEPVWIFTGSGAEPGPAIDPVLLPHVLVPGERPVMTEFTDRLASLASVQLFGWMAQCVLDGQLAMSTLPGHAHLRDAAQRQLDLFLHGDKLVYEGPRSEPIVDRIYGIEGSGPLAAIAKLRPGHPVIDLTLKFWQSRRDAQGAIIDGKHTSSEGSYTVAYPLACIGTLRQSDELQHAALEQLRIRQRRLFDGRQFHRTSNAGGPKGNLNWSRGLAWQMLGIARTLHELPRRGDTADLKQASSDLADYAVKMQRSDGLWGVFMDDPTLVADTAGSTGIAAAIALGVRDGYIDPSLLAHCRRTLGAVQRQLTPDGLLAGVSQSNKGGEGLQRSDYRVISQMGMGLLAQLVTALETA